MREQWSAKLNKFYAENSAYHEMTAGGTKLDHPQVRLLLSLIKPGGVYAEVGCGGARPVLL